MGYTIKIGNKIKLSETEDDGTIYSWDSVQDVSLDDAPCFDNDFTGHTNTRRPSYSAWSDFCKAVGLTDLFFNNETGLMAKHPDCVPITESHVSIVSEALNRYQAESMLPPGFGKHDSNGSTRNYDHHLARLIWLEWWMRWAVNNCEHPSFKNS